VKHSERAAVGRTRSSPSHCVRARAPAGCGNGKLVLTQHPETLFGYTVTQIDLGRFALNDRFQMAFSYTLTDGRSGIAIASFNGER